MQHFMETKPRGDKPWTGIVTRVLEVEDVSVSKTDELIRKLKF